MNEQRYLLVVSGPSGVGKDTVVQRLMQLHPEIQLSVSATTRAPREGEVDGVSYHFYTDEQFQAALQNGELLESTCYVGKCYGTPKSEVDKRIQNGITCVLVIEVEGAENIKRLYPESTTIFLLPPSAEELERRLRKRGSESDERIAQRMTVARHEMSLAETYDYQLVNNHPDEAAEAIYAILHERQV